MSAGITRRTFLGGAMATGAALSVPRAWRRGGVPDPTALHVTRWASDPFSLGSYSYLGVGATNDDRRALAEPVADRLFFAGEATSAAHAATVHGAFLSGRRAAHDVRAVARTGDNVVVIGAGVAGLAAAAALRRAGHDVTVVEGRDRIGGRIDTIERLGVPLDLGASWIHGTRENPITRLARDAGVRTAPTDYENSVLFGPGGERISASRARAMYERYRYVMDEIKRPQETLDTDISLGAAIDEVVRRDGDWTARERRDLAYVLNVELESDYAADVHDLSLFWFDAGDAFGGPDVLFPDTGFAWLPRLLARRLDVRLGHVVELVEWRDDGVTVTTSRGPIDAARAVVSLPLGVLRSGSVGFAPGLPDAKRAAISRLGTGLLNKLWLRFPRVFWDRDVDIIDFVSPVRGRWTEWYDFSRHTGEPILLGFNAATSARDLEPRTDAETVADAMRVLRTLYG